eukprot:TRINITY_DN11394_c0_g5_i1.p1 TRINITY_DN11394_c0_g5~~TRINITY_DN11394_c0_g5_i1.p1  ORF type:complete len:351 (-),score=40.30 TRINITY_DN11394_c0_g5_i1:77-1129(-)
MNPVEGQLIGGTGSGGQKCKIGCGRSCPNGYTTCCRDCALSNGKSHSQQCTTTFQALRQEPRCKMGCGRCTAGSGYDTCCRECVKSNGRLHSELCTSRATSVTGGYGGAGCVNPAPVAGYVVAPGAPSPPIVQAHIVSPGFGHAEGAFAGHHASSSSGGHFVLVVDSAKDLYDLDYLGKMDPFVEICIGSRKFQTQVMTNADKKPKWHWSQVIDWHGEPDIFFRVKDKNICVADGLIGEARYNMLSMRHNFDDYLELMRPHRMGGMQKAGKLYIEIKWSGAAGAPTGHMGHGMPAHPPIHPAHAGQMLLGHALGFGKKHKKEKKDKAKKHKKEKKHKKHKSSSSSSSSSS